MDSGAGLRQGDGVEAGLAMHGLRTRAKLWNRILLLFTLLRYNVPILRVQYGGF